MKNLTQMQLILKQEEGSDQQAQKANYTLLFVIRLRTASISA
jgi:hypothetical protein